METAQLHSFDVQAPVSQLKESTRDMVRLQRDYQLSDELFWEVFNARVLLNEQIDIDAFITDSNRSPAYA
ncbi:hypothetical protein [Spirosoma radiotolerans]|uniref:Uncharacterized protein n=1 Tax=Spirosoma radiotolerans TaxID=1379870 RepID=A0A0E3ZUE9_9BACT|nr:hypothetical protein [Spirosoma radiotolerans]AKD54424.1 hypothetical protein SD10_05365 [Spirosoma radiotolerans]